MTRLARLGWLKRVDWTGAQGQAAAPAVLRRVDWASPKAQAPLRAPRDSAVRGTDAARGEGSERARFEKALGIYQARMGGGRQDNTDEEKVN